METKINKPMVQELTVTVKTVMIGNRQMTKSVLRQIPYRTEITGQVLGVIRCHPEEKHFPMRAYANVLWTEDNKLYRTYFSIETKNPEGYLNQIKRDELVDSINHAGQIYILT